MQKLRDMVLKMNPSLFYFDHARTCKTDVYDNMDKSNMERDRYMSENIAKSIYHGGINHLHYNCKVYPIKLKLEVFLKSMKMKLIFFRKVVYFEEDGNKSNKK